MKRKRREPDRSQEALLGLVAALAQLPLDEDRNNLYRADDDEPMAYEAPARVWKELIEAADRVGVW